LSRCKYLHVEIHCSLATVKSCVIIGPILMLSHISLSERLKHCNGHTHACLWLFIPLLLGFRHAGTLTCKAEPIATVIDKCMVYSSTATWWSLALYLDCMFIALGISYRVDSSWTVAVERPLWKASAQVFFSTAEQGSSVSMTYFWDKMWCRDATQLPNLECMSLAICLCHVTCVCHASYAYVTITKPCSASLHFAYNFFSTWDKNSLYLGYDLTFGHGCPHKLPKFTSIILIAPWKMLDAVIGNFSIAFYM